MNVSLKFMNFKLKFIDFTLHAIFQSVSLPEAEKNRLYYFCLGMK